MDLIGDFVNFNDELIGRLGSISHELKETEEQEQNIDTLEMLKRRIQFEVGINQEIWNPRRILNKIDNFLQDGAFKCNIDSGCERFASNIHAPQYYCDKHSKFKEEFKGNRVRFEEIKKTIKFVNKDIFKTVSIYRFIESGFHSFNKEEVKEICLENRNEWNDLINRFKEINIILSKVEPLTMKEYLTIEKGIDIIKIYLNELMIYAKNPLLSLISDSLFQKIVQLDGGIDDSPNNDKFVPSNDENKAYKVCSIFAEDEKNIETSENVLEICEKRRNSEIENLNETISKIKTINESYENFKLQNNTVECENCGNNKEVNLKQTFINRNKKVKLLIPKKEKKCRCLRQLFVYIMIIMFALLLPNLVPFVFKELCNMRTRFQNYLNFMPLILKGIVRPTLDGKFNVEINLTTNPRDLEILSTYRIPEVDYLSIYINDCSQNVKEFLSNNKIGSIKHFYFYNTAPYINLNSCMDVLMKTAKRVTIYFELAYWTIGTDGFATLFNSLTQESSLTLVLSNIRRVPNNSFPVLNTANSAVRELQIFNNDNFRDSLYKHVLAFLDSIGNTIIASSKFEVFYFYNDNSGICCDKIIEKVHSYNNEVKVEFNSKCDC